MMELTTLLLLCKRILAVWHKMGAVALNKKENFNKRNNITWHRNNTRGNTVSASNIATIG